jgi:WD40 repeat protein
MHNVGEMNYDAHRVTHIPTAKTPSMLFNNLTCNGTTVAFAHKTEVVTFSESSGTRNSAIIQETAFKPRLPVSKVIQVKWCHLSGRDYLVVGTGAGVAVYDNTCTSNLFVMELTSQNVPFPDPEASFVRGITAVPGTNYICVGSSTGHIFAFQVQEDKIELAHTLLPYEDDDGAATSALTGANQWLVTASDSGSVMIYDTTTNSTSASSSSSSSASTPFQRTARFPGTCPCTSLCIANEYVVGGYTTGQLRLFHLTTGVIFCEIGAHTRAVTALDAHPDESCFVSTGEDSVLSVWKITAPPPSTETKSTTRQAPVITVEFTTVVPDSLLTGVVFSRNGTSNLITASYDQKKIQLFTNQ